MNIKIPERFCSKMDEDLLTECKGVFTKYEKLAESQMCFFPEYTDHSYRHIQYVLDTADHLIPDKAMRILGSLDIFELCLGVLFHDLGMHINFYSLQTLYKEDKKSELTGWKMKDLWQQYIKEEHRECRELFDPISIPEEDFKKYEEQAAGFVRRQHPHIAQIIAEHGFPCKDGFIEYGEKSNPGHYRLAGYIARSHGMDLRQAAEYLRQEYGNVWKTPYGCYAVYLMCIVRIADYLHITDDRVNKYRLNLQNFNSPISREEYLKHRSVCYSQAIYDNPETIHMEIQVDHCSLYLEMIALLECIQRELDSSWAVLGEVYGKSELDIAIRRITSNILSEEWEKKSAFVPERLSFHYDGSLMGLLISPLYGNNPSYAVREFIQNATDACKTRKAADGEGYVPKVEIRVGDGFFEIVDNGIGMTLKTIRDYFLNIGSSSRKSEEYRAVNSSVEGGIQRNGRFGIGILSGFLLGEEIAVTTRAKEEDTQYQFSTRKDTKAIEIKKACKTGTGYAGGDPYGTRIRIRLSEGVDPKELLVKEWYRLDDVGIEVKGQGGTPQPDGSVIKREELEGRNEKITWKKLTSGEKYGFQEVYWSKDYRIGPIRFGGRENKKMEYLEPDLICNGILIPDSYARRMKSTFIEKWPVVLISDPQGKLELNLSRDEVRGTLPFAADLEAELMKEFAEFFKQLAEGDSGHPREKAPFDGQTLRYSMLKFSGYQPQRILYTRQGYLLYARHFIREAGIKKVLRIWTKEKREFHVQELLDEGVGYVLEGEGTHPDLKNEMVDHHHYYPFEFAGRQIIYLHNLDYENYKNYSAHIYRLSKGFMERTVIESLDDRKKEDFGLDMDLEEVTMIIEYGTEGKKDLYPDSYEDTDSILPCFEGRVVIPYTQGTP